MLPRVFTNEPKMTNLFESIFNDQMFPSIYKTAKSGCSSVNIIDNEKDITLQVVVPGYKKEDITIDMNNDILTITAKENEEVEKLNYLRREFCSGAFSRSFTMPDYLDQEKVSAVHENGILSVVIAKKEQAIKKGPRQISIS